MSTKASIVIITNQSLVVYKFRPQSELSGMQVGESTVDLKCSSSQQQKAADNSKAKKDKVGNVPTNS